MTGRRAAWHAGVALAGLNACACLFAIALTPPLPASYLELHPSVTTIEHGVQFELRSSDPLLILAGRPFGDHHAVDEPVTSLGLLLNLPAVLSAALAVWGLEESLGRRAATWVGTVLFFIVSSVQWLFLGWGGAAFAGRRQVRNGRTPDRTGTL